MEENIKEKSIHQFLDIEVSIQYIGHKDYLNNLHPTYKVKITNKRGKFTWFNHVGSIELYNRCTNHFYPDLLFDVLKDIYTKYDYVYEYKTPYNQKLLNVLTSDWIDNIKAMVILSGKSLQ